MSIKWIAQSSRKNYMILLIILLLVSMGIPACDNGEDSDSHINTDTPTLVERTSTPSPIKTVTPTEEAAMEPTMTPYTGEDEATPVHTQEIEEEPEATATPSIEEEHPAEFPDQTCPDEMIDKRTVVYRGWEYHISDETLDWILNNCDIPKPELTLTFETNPHSITPMGETQTHGGDPHGGIDFYWDTKPKLYSFEDGVVMKIVERDHGDAIIYDVNIKIGIYAITYQELESSNPELEVGMEVQKGDFIGYPWDPGGNKMFHWDFGYYHDYDQYPNPRLCPVPFLDQESELLLEEIWANTEWEYKDQFPYICNGPYSIE